MTMQVWWLFVGITFLVSATPGPNMLQVMSVSVRHGMRHAVMTMAGCMSALLAMMSLSAAGLGALLLTFPEVFKLLRWAGAAYLAWLGLKSWRAPVHDQSGDAGYQTQPPGGRWGLYRQGLLVALSNPKAILFAAAFLPQFIRPDRPTLPQFVILLATFAVVEIAWYLVYAASGRRLSHWLRRAEVVRLFNRMTGGVFIGFAVWMAAVRE